MGDATGIDELRQATQQELHEAGKALGETLRFGRATTLRILGGWERGLLTDVQVRWWALLMFIGAFPEEWTPIGWKIHHSSQPLDIDYSDDEDVNDVVFRLQELGEFGSQITNEERIAMVFRLLGPAGR
jgi:hypothetical protein